MTSEASDGQDSSSPTVLDLTRATGLWVVLSSSPTRYFVDTRGLLLRNHGVGSPRLPFDDEWVPLVQVRSYDPVTLESVANQVRCGARIYYLTDPRGGALDYEWRLQRTVTAIRQVSAVEAKEMYERVPLPDTPLVPEWASERPR
ncbi:MAG: hypothetical protein HGA44_09515 [Cellulomonadaceae bacterium]|nr:hypothetical protein [Cellulomonadaceae bacterium]